MMLEIVSSFENRRMHLLHRIAQFDSESTENIALPRVVLGVDSRLHLLVVDDAHAKRFLGIGRVERRPRFLDLC